MTLDDLVSYYKALVLDPETRRQLSVHCHCSKHAIGGDFEAKAKAAAAEAKAEAKAKAAEEKASAKDGEGASTTDGAAEEEEEAEEQVDTDVEPTLIDFGELKSWQDSMSLYAADIDVKA